jgi:hypothetical protein
LAEVFFEAVVGVAGQLPLAVFGERRRCERGRAVQRATQRLPVVREGLQNREPAVDREDADSRARRQLAREALERRPACESPRGGPQAVEDQGQEDR